MESNSNFLEEVAKGVRGFDGRLTTEEHQRIQIGVIQPLEDGVDLKKRQHAHVFITIFFEVFVWNSAFLWPSRTWPGRARVMGKEIPTNQRRDMFFDRLLNISLIDMFARIGSGPDIESMVGH